MYHMSIRAQTAPSPADVQRQEEIKEEIEGLQEDLIELKEKTVEIEEAIAGLHEDIMEAGGMDLRIQKICVNDMRKKIDNLNNKITKNMVAKSKAEKDVTKLESSIVKFERESEKFEHNLKDLDDELQSCAQNLEEIIEKVNKAKEVNKEKRTVYYTAKTQIFNDFRIVNGREKE